MSSSTSRAWMAAASVAAVEAMKYQGFCRWNHTLRSLHKHSGAKNNLRSSVAAAQSSNSKKRMMREQKANHRRSEESLRTVMYLSCWGPNN